MRTGWESHVPMARGDREVVLGRYAVSIVLTSAIDHDV